MSSVNIFPSVLNGRISVPPSKSAAHRAVICSALANGKDIFSSDEFLSDDIKATISAVKSLKTYKGELMRIDCKESGSTLRFLIPIAAAQGITAEFVGHGRLPCRPIGVYLDCLPNHGIECKTEGGLPLKIKGQLTPGKFILPGNVSSQFITGLLLALPLLNGDSEIILSSPLESAAYVDMTTEIMESFGVTVQKSKNGWYINGSQKYMQTDFKVERDWSQAAFFIAAGALGGNVKLLGLNKNSCQGDKAAEKLFRCFGAYVKWTNSVLSVSPNKLNGINIDASQIPDLVPILAATAAFCNGRTCIFNAGRLRIKESDRLSAIAEGLNRLGGKVKETNDGLIIDGIEKLHGGKVDGYNDHRIVMALSIAALNADGCVEITDAQSISKSYPNFFKDYNMLGGKADVVNLG